MPFRSNRLSFFLALVLALVFAGYALFALEENRFFIRDAVSFSPETMTLTLMDTDYTMSPALHTFLSEWTSNASETASVFLPDAAVSAVKETAAWVFAAGKYCISGINGMIRGLVRGNL